MSHLNKSRLSEKESNRSGFRRRAWSLEPHFRQDGPCQGLNIELERLGIYASHVQIYPSPKHGWTATVMASPARVVEYQAFADGIAANLRQQYALKD